MSEVSNTSPPLQETERDKWNFDVGFEEGFQERDRAPRTVDEALDRIKVVLRELIHELDQHIAAGRAVGR